ncbi:MAG: hypothetical protein KA841_01030 [Chitinophagales bacterium]|nr:hypothetical protein [Chitinophagales bacterium]
MRFFKYSVFYSTLFLLTSCSASRLFHTQQSGEVKALLSQYLYSHVTPPQDPAHYDSIWSAVPIQCPQLSDLYWLVPSADLPKDLKIRNSNNNVSIAIFKSRMYMAFRTGPTHFASRKTGMYIISTADGMAWQKEMELLPGRDVREPFLIEIRDTLHFYCFAAGKSMTSFAPEYISHYSRTANTPWQGPSSVLTKGEVHWSIKNRNGKTYMTSYEGSHYQLKGDSEVSLFFKETTDGQNFTTVGDSERVYFGGVSETDYEFDINKNLWAVTRLEDGDKTGFGSHVVYADKSRLDFWEFPDTAEQECYMSPRMFRQGDEIYLIARKQLGGKPFGQADRHKPMKRQRLKNWISYSLSPKTTALYHINQSTRKVEWLMNLSGAGDTAFPSILRLDAYRLLIANYSSPLKFSKRSWLAGQLGKTGIYLQVITFNSCSNTTP